MSCGAEDATQCFAVSGGADGKAKTGNAVCAEFFESPVCVGFRVTAFVAVVVRKSVREDDQEPIRCSGLDLQDFSRATDTGAQTCVARRLEMVETGSTDGAETLSERLYCRQMDGMPALRTECVDSDTVSELFERDGERSGRAPLMIVYCQAVGIGISGGSGSVEQDEDAEIALEFAPFQVDVFRW